MDIDKILEDHLKWLENGKGKKANLSWTKLSWAYLSGANLSEADLRGADLSWADLLGANLSGANLSEANLSEADLRGANLEGVKYSHGTIGIHPAPEGELIGWGKKSGVIVKLKIPADSKRSCATTRKHRCEYAIVLDVENDEKEVVVENMYATTVYKVGEEVRCHEWDENRWNECSGGIHFFLTRKEAESWD